MRLHLPLTIIARICPIRGGFPTSRMNSANAALHSPIVGILWGIRHTFEVSAYRFGVRWNQRCRQLQGIWNIQFIATSDTYVKGTITIVLRPFLLTYSSQQRHSRSYPPQPVLVQRTLPSPYLSRQSPNIQSSFNKQVPARTEFGKNQIWTWRIWSLCSKPKLRTPCCRSRRTMRDLFLA